MGKWDALRRCFHGNDGEGLELPRGTSKAEFDAEVGSMCSSSSDNITYAL